MGAVHDKFGYYTALFEQYNTIQYGFFPSVSPPKGGFRDGLAALQRAQAQPGGQRCGQGSGKSVKCREGSGRLRREEMSLEVFAE